MSLAVALGVGPVGAEPTPSDVASAKALVAEGRDRRNSGDHRGAAMKFKAAWAVVRTPIIGLDLVREHLALGQLVEAREVADTVVALPANPKESAEGKSAREESKKISARLATSIPTLVVKTKGLAKDTPVEVRIDGSVEKHDAQTPMSLNPGKHKVVVLAAGEQRSTEVVLKENQHSAVTLDFRDASGPEEAKLSDPPSLRSPSNTWSYVAFGVSGVFLITGTYGLVTALSRDGAIKDACNGPPSACALPPEEIDRRVADRNSMRTLAVASFLIAGAAFGVGYYLYTPRPATTASLPSVRIGLGWVALDGRF